MCCPTWGGGAGGGGGRCTEIVDGPTLNNLRRFYCLLNRLAAAVTNGNNVIYVLSYVKAF